MSNIITQELISEVIENLHPKIVFELWFEKNSYRSKRIAISADIEKLIEFAWKHHYDQVFYENRYDKTLFIKELSENKMIHIYEWQPTTYFIKNLLLEGVLVLM